MAVGCEGGVVVSTRGRTSAAPNKAVEPTGYSLRSHPAAHRWRYADSSWGALTMDTEPRLSEVPAGHLDEAGWLTGECLAVSGGLR